MLKGSVVRARGVITAVRTEGSETLVELDLWTEAGAGHRMVPARATVLLKVVPVSGWPCRRAPQTEKLKCCSLV